MRNLSWGIYLQLYRVGLEGGAWIKYKGTYCPFKYMTICQLYVLFMRCINIVRSFTVYIVYSVAFYSVIVDVDKKTSSYCMYQYIVTPSGMSIVLHTPYPDSIQTSERG